MTAAFDLARLDQCGLVGSIDYHESLGSTSDRALALAAADEARLPLLVLAARQTAGRGRGTNRWWSDEGALTFSLALEAHPALLPAANWPQIALVAGLAVCEALHRLAPSGNFRVKWPNDVYLNDRKICGILSESVPGWRDRLVIGIGVNVNNGVKGTVNRGPAAETGRHNRAFSTEYSVLSTSNAGGQPPRSATTGQPSLTTTAISLIEHDGLPRDLTDTLLAVLDYFDHHWSILLNGGFALLAAAYRDRCLLTGKAVTIEQAGGQSLVGLCRGIDETGALRLCSERGEQQVVSGSVTRWDTAARLLTPDS
jgi:BirA family biotin operon repressor/biotin-[acetyl-CoA-carboxylase] ligase